MSNKPPSSKEDLVRENVELRVRLEGLRSARATSNITAVIRELIKYGVPSYCGYKAVDALAGKATFVDASVEGAVDVCGSLAEKLGESGLLWVIVLAMAIVSSAAVISNSRYRRLNRSLAGRIGVQVKQAEEAVDPKRTSSGLAIDGQTNERDDA